MPQVGRALRVARAPVSALTQPTFFEGGAQSTQKKCTITAHSRTVSQQLSPKTPHRLSTLTASPPPGISDALQIGLTAHQGAPTREAGHAQRARRAACGKPRSAPKHTFGVRASRSPGHKVPLKRRYASRLAGRFAQPSGLLSTLEACAAATAVGGLGFRGHHHSVNCFRVLGFSDA